MKIAHFEPPFFSRMRTSQSEITTARSRRIYAKMDVSSMGVDVDTGPVIADKENNQ